MSTKDEVEERLEELVFGTRDAITEDMAIVSEDEEESGVKKTRVSKFKPAWIDEDDSEDFEFDDTSNPKWAQYIINQPNEESLWAQDSVTRASEKLSPQFIKFERVFLKQGVKYPKFVQFHDSGALVLAATSKGLNILSLNPNDTSSFLRKEIPDNLTAVKFANSGKELIYVVSKPGFFVYDIEKENIRRVKFQTEFQKMVNT